MFDDKCVPEPLGTVLNMLVDSFLSPNSQGAECERSVLIVQLLQFQLQYRRSQAKRDEFQPWPFGMPTA
jgi:hypothetical protein